MLKFYEHPTNTGTPPPQDWHRKVQHFASWEEPAYGKSNSQHTDSFRLTSFFLQLLPAVPLGKFW